MRLRRGAVLLALTLLVGGLALASSVDATGAPTVDPAVAVAVAQGWARVLVELRVPGPPDPSAVATTQDAVLARLTGVPFRLIRRYQTVPFLALEIGREALAALETMGGVVSRVLPDQAVPTTGGGAPPSPRRDQ